MSVDCQDKIEGISELVRSHRYEVDPVAVADAIVQRIVWKGAPVVAPGAAPAAGPGRAPRLRGVVRVQRLVSPPPLTPGPALRA